MSQLSLFARNETLLTDDERGQVSYVPGFVDPAAAHGWFAELREARRVINVELEAGSLLVMDYTTQLHYTHAVPKTADPVEERISLAFRVKPAR